MNGVSLDGRMDGKLAKTSGEVSERCGTIRGWVHADSPNTGPRDEEGSLIVIFRFGELDEAASWPFSKAAALRLWLCFDRSGDSMAVWFQTGSVLLAYTV